ncbi:YraN family protein [uncultured Tateyamaria sp.]|uniref:YraN family protein n=1 Tax=uncultured Tateyamaria sp. TaxID=455651 RepID=UPI0026073FE3|nr:YraN family protein [uncultured Tateyamaria sp.]
MSFADRDHSFQTAPPVIPAQNVHRGRMAYHAGLAAEDQIARHFVEHGHIILEQRWHGQRGEIDLIVADGDTIVFVEVKQSRDFDTALSHVTPAQVRRLYTTGEEYLGTLADGSLRDVRFDVALVDGTGAVRLMENAFGPLF